MKTRRTFTMAAMVFTAAGCVGAPPDEPTGAAADALAVEWNTIQLAYRGGAGGAYGDVACAPGDIATGVFGSSSEYTTWSWVYGSGRFVSRVGLVCRRVQPDGTLTGPYTTAALGSPVNGSNPLPFRYECPAGTAVVRLTGRAATYVDAIGVLCSDKPVRYVDPQPPAGSVAAGELVAISGSYGGTGGTWFSDPCPTDGRWALQRLSGRSGSWLDGVQGACVQLSGNAAPPPPPPTPTYTFCRTCTR